MELGIENTLFGVATAFITFVGFYLSLLKFKKDNERDTAEKEKEHQKLHDEHDKIAKDNQNRICKMEEFAEASRKSNSKRKEEIAEVKSNMNREFTDLKVSIGKIETTQDAQTKMLEKIDKKLDEKVGK